MSDTTLCLFFDIKKIVKDEKDAVGLEDASAVSAHCTEQFVKAADSDLRIFTGALVVDRVLLHILSLSASSEVQKSSREIH